MKVPYAAKKALRRHVARAVARLDPARYKQEPAYVAALFGRLDDVVYRGSKVTVEMRSTVVEDRGPGSAESIWGADFGIVASIANGDETVEKAVLGQAKRGSLTSLSGVHLEEFRSQVVKMGAATWATIGLEVPPSAGTIPVVRIVEVSRTYGPTWAAQTLRTRVRHYERTIFAQDGNAPPVLVGSAIPLDEYLYLEVIRCIHGDTDSTLVAGLEHSSLTTLRLNVYES